MHGQYVQGCLEKCFENNYRFIGKTLCSDIKTILGKIGMLSSLDDKLPINLNVVEDRFMELHKLEWVNKIQSVSKLWTNRQFKSKFGTKNYLLSNLSKTEKITFSSTLSLRCGILPLRVGTGQYVELNVNEQTCSLRNLNETENEMHLIQMYSLWWFTVFIYKKALETHDDFSSHTDSQKLIYVTNSRYIHIAKFIVTAMRKWKLSLYN